MKRFFISEKRIRGDLLRGKLLLAGLKKKIKKNENPDL
jgi:hypothetical protein